MTQKSKLPKNLRGPRIVRAEREFPKVRVTGGPSPHDLEISIDGERVKKISELDLHAGVNRAVTSVAVRQYVELDVEVDVEVERGYVAVLRQPESGETGVIKSWTEIGRGTGKTLREAVFALAEAIPEEVVH